MTCWSTLLDLWRIRSMQALPDNPEQPGLDRVRWTALDAWLQEDYATVVFGRIPASHCA